MRLEIKLQGPPNRQRHKSVPYSERVASIIAKNYGRLKDEYNRGQKGNYYSMSYEDIFQEAILFVIQDKQAFNMTEDEIIKHFGYRYSMIRFQTIQDSKQYNTIHAVNIQTKEENE